MKKYVEPKFNLELIEESINNIADSRLDGYSFKKQTVKDDISGIEFFECVFENIIFNEHMANMTFVDVVFDHCDFSNCDIHQSTFRRVEFKSCRVIGSDFTGSSFQDVNFDSCLCDYVNFNKSKIRDSVFDECICNGSYFSGIDHKNLYLHNVNLIESEWFHTKMKKLDFSDCQIDGIRIAVEDLNGLEVNSFQAIELAKILGIIVK